MVLNIQPLLLTVAILVSLPLLGMLVVRQLDHQRDQIEKARLLSHQPIDVRTYHPELVAGMPEGVQRVFQLCHYTRHTVVVGSTIAYAGSPAVGTPVTIYRFALCCNTGTCLSVRVYLECSKRVRVYAHYWLGKRELDSLLAIRNHSSRPYRRQQRPSEICVWKKCSRGPFLVACRTATRRRSQLVAALPEHYSSTCDVQRFVSNDRYDYR